MQCPHCGADTEAARPDCQACGLSLQVAAGAVAAKRPPSKLFAESAWGPKLLRVLIALVVIAILLQYGRSRMAIVPREAPPLAGPTLRAPEPTFPMPEPPTSLRQAELIQPAPVDLPELPVFQIAFGSRDPRVKAEFLERGGGGKDTEDAVDRGLRWLSKKQLEDGSWNAESFGGRAEFTLGVTGLSLLAFLGAGHTHMTEGPYKETVAKAIQYLLRQQNAQGLFPGRLYHQGICTMAIVEAYGMTGDSTLEPPSYSGTQVIAGAQQANGGWDYYPGSSGRGDTSVTGWQVMALKSAKRVGIKYPPEVLDRARQFLSDMTRADGAIAYDTKNLWKRNPYSLVAMTAVGLNAHLFAGGDPKDENAQRAIGLLLRNIPTHHKLQGKDLSPPANIYFWYHGALALSRVGGQEWKAWNNGFKKDGLKYLLLKLQGQDGSWEPYGDTWARHGAGKIYFTALAILALEVYYRYD